MCDCFHLAFPNWHAASAGTGGRRLRGPEAATEDDSVSDSICDEPAQFTEGERPRPQGSSPVEEFPETEKYADSDKECDAEHDQKGGSGKKTKKSGLGFMFEKRSTPKMNKLKEVPSPESGVIVKTAKDGCAEGLVYGGGGRDGIFIKGVVPESPASKSLKLKEGDQILSATVYFDNVSYEDAIQILEHAQAYKMKLCLKRKPDISQTDPTIESDVIPEEELYAPEMREQGKTKRRGDARISWPKFPSFGKGRKGHFTRSHSSSEADEQRKLELSPTTSDTESPIKSQDALKGKKKHKMKLSVLTKRGRISSSDDQDTDALTTGQTSSEVQQTQESDMLSPECLESPSGDTPQVYVTENVKEIGDSRLDQNNQTLTETPQHKVELISVDNTLKTTDLTVALADKEGSPGIKSPDGKKKKKERSELKIKILGKDKSQKKAKSSPKRLKTLGASLDAADQNEGKKSDTAPSGLDAKTQIEMNLPKMELDVPDVETKQKSPQKGKDKKHKGNLKEDTKAGATFKLPKVELSGTTTEEALQKVNENEEYKPKIEQLISTGTESKEDPYDKLAISSRVSTQLPKREDIEIPGMEDKPAKTKAKKSKEAKAGQKEETVQMLIDVDSVKEAVSKLPGYKLPKVDTSGVPIPEEITVIDANAQRISVKTPTKVIDPKTKYETHFTKFDMTASPDTSKTSVKLPKMRSADLTTEELLFETNLEVKKLQQKTKMQHSHKEIKTGAYEREDIVIPGRESTHIIQQKDDGIKGEKTIYLQDVKISQTEEIGEIVSDVKILEIDGIEYIDSVEGSPAKNAAIGQSGLEGNLETQLKADISLPEVRGKGQDVKEEELTVAFGGVTPEISMKVQGRDENITGDGSAVKSFQNDAKGSKFKMPSIGISLPKVKETKIDLNSSKKDAAVKLPEAPEIDVTLGRVDVSISEEKMKVEKPELELKPVAIKSETDERGIKFKMPKFGIKMPKIEGPKFDLSSSKRDGEVSLSGTNAEIKLPDAPKVDISLGSVDVSIPEQKMIGEKPELEIETSQVEGELDQKGAKFKIPKLGISMPKAKGPEVDVSLPQTAVDVTLPEATGKIHVPDAETKKASAKVEIKSSESKVGEKDGERSPLKFKMPTFKLPKFEVASPNMSGENVDAHKGVKIERDAKIPEEVLQVNIEKPSIDVSGPSIDLKTSGRESKEKDGKFKMPSLGFSMPKVKGPKIDAKPSKKDVDVNLPTMKADINLPKADLGEADVSLPGAKVKVPDAEVEIKLPEVPEVDLEVKAPEYKVEVEGYDGKVKLPNAPKMDVTLGKPHVELEEQESKFKLPKFGVSMPKMKGPEINLGLSKKEADISAPEVKGDVHVSDVQLKAPSAKVEIKGPQVELAATDTEGTSSHFKMPDMSFSMPKVQGPDLNLKFSKKDADIKLPHGKAQVTLPEAPEVEATLGGVDVSLPEQKLNIEKPEVEVKLQEVDAGVEGQGTELKLQKFGITMPKVKGPEFDLSLSKTDVDVALPSVKAEVKLPDVEVKKPSAEVEIRAPDIKVGTKDTKGSPLKFKMPSFKLPKFGVGAPSISAEGPDFNQDIKIDGTNIKIPDESLTVNIEAPNIETKGPSIDIKTTEIEHEQKGDKFKLPSLGFKGPDIDVKLPEVKSEVNIPDVEMKKPSAEVEIESPEIKVSTKDMKGSPSKFKMPSFKMPKLGFGTPGVTASMMDKDKNINLEGADITIPEETLTVNIAVPSIDVQGPKIDIKTKEIEGKMGKIKVKSPDVDISKKDVNINLPDVKAEGELPGIDMKPPECEMNIDGKGGKFKMPEFGITMPKVKGPEFDFKLAKKDVDVTLPQAKVEVNLPDAELKELTADVKGSPSKLNLPAGKLPTFGATVEAPGVDKDSGIEKEGKGSKFKVPKFGISLPKVQGPQIDLSLSKKDVQLPKSKADVKIPETPGVDIDPGKVEVLTSDARIEIEKPEMTIKPLEIEGEGTGFKMPKMGIKMPKIEGPQLNVSMPKKETDVKLPEMDVTLGSVAVSISEPKTGVEKSKQEITPLQIEGECQGQETEFTMPKFGIALPKVTGPDANVEMALPEANSEVKLPGVDLRKSAAEVELKGPESKIPTKDTDGSPSKFKMPKLKLPKFGIALPSVTAEVPDVDKNVKIDGGDIQVPEEVLTVEVAAPKIDVKGPSIDIKTKESEQERRGSKFRFPSLGFKGPDVDISKREVEVKLPEVKADVKFPDIEVKKPSAEMDVKVPEVDLKTSGAEGSPSKMKLPTFKLPKFGISAPEVSVEVPDKDIKVDGADVKFEGGKIEAKLPDVDIKEPSGSISVSQAPEAEVDLKSRKTSWTMPRFSFSMGSGKAPEADINLEAPKVDVTIPEVKTDVNLDIKDAPSVSVEGGTAPDVDVKLKKPRFSLPKISFSKQSIKELEVDVTPPKVDVSLAEGTVEVKQPDMKVKQPEGEMDLDGEKSKFKFPGLGFKGPEIDLSVSKKDVDVSLPEMKAEVKLPEVDVKKPSAEVEIKSPEIKLTAKDTDGSPSKFKMPSFKIPKFGIVTPSGSAEVPDMDKNVKIDGAEIKIPEEVLTVEVAAPNIDIKGPSIDIKTKELEQDRRGSKFKFPGLGFKGPEIDLSLSKKDVAVSLPEMKAEVKLPEVDVKKPSAEVEIKSPEIKLTAKDTDGSPSKFKMPSFKIPKFGIVTPSVSAEVPDMDKNVKIDGAEIKIPEEVLTVEVAAPNIDIKGPSIDIKTKELEQDRRGSKFKFPGLGFKGADVDLSASKKEVDVTLPEVKAEVKLPDVKVGKPSAEVEIKSPEVKIGATEIDGSPSKFKMPSFKLPKFAVGASSVSAELPEMDKDIKIEGAEMKIPEEVLSVEVAAPTVDIKGPSIDMKTKESDQQRRGSKFKFPSLGFKGPDVDITKKDVDVTVPEVKAEVKLPEVEVKKPSVEVEVKSPEIKLGSKEVDGSPSKFKMPSFKLPKFGVGTPSVSAEVPDMDKDVQIDGADIKFPEEVLTVEVAAPKIDVKGPSIDIKTKEPEQERRGSKFRFPSLGFKGPDVDISKREVEVKLPEVKADVKPPDIEVKKPSAEMDVKVPGVDLKTSGAEGSPSKMKLPTFKLPKFGVSAPEVSVEVPDKDIKVDGADVKLEGGKIEAKLPDVDIKEPSGSISVSQAPEAEVDLKSRKTSWTMPRFSFSMGSGKAPEADINLEAPKVDVTIPEVKTDVNLDIKDAPSVSVEGGTAPDVDVKLKKPRFSLPKISFSKQSIKEPEVDVTPPKVDVSLAEGTVEVKQPDMKVKQPEGEMKLDGEKSKFKFPSLGFKGPEIDLSVSKKDVDVSLPEMKAEVKLPEVDVKKPSAEVEIKSPEIKLTAKDTDGSPSKFKMPSFKMPKFGVGTPRVSAEVPDMDKNVKIDGAEIKIPEEVLTVEVAAPNIDIKGPSIDIKTKELEQDRRGSKFKFPGLGFKGADVDLSASKKEVDVTLPEVKAEVKLPDVKVGKPSAEVEIKSPEVKIGATEIDGSPSKFKMPSFKLPKFGAGASSASAELPEMDKDIKIEGAEMKIPEEVLSVEVAAPTVDIKGPSIDMKTKESDQQRRGSKFKFPSLGFKGPDVDITKKDVDVTLPEVKAEVKLPEVEVKKPSVEVEVKSPEIKLGSKEVDGSPSKFKMPSFKLPKFGVGTPSVSAEVPDMDKDVQIDGADIKVPEEVLTVEVAAPKIDVKGPSIDITTKEPEQERRGSKFRFPSLGFKGPDVDISKREVEVKLPEVKADVKLPDIEVKKPSAEMDVKVPGVDLKTSGAEGSPSKMKLPTFKLPKFGVSAPEVSVEVPDKDIKVDGADVKLEGGKIEAKLPDVDIKEPSGSISVSQAPEAEVDLKSRKTSWTMPRFSFSMGSGKAPEADINLEAPKVDVTIPEVKTDVNLDIKDAPIVSVEGGTAPDVDVKLKKPRFSLPKISFSKQSIKELEVDVTPPKVDVSLAEGTVEVRQPDMKVKQPEGEMKLDGEKSKFKFPSLGFKGPEIDLSVSKKDVDVSLPEMKAEVKLPEVDVKKPSAEVEIKSPEIKLTAKDTDGSPSKFKMPSFKMPKFGVGTPSVSAEVPDMDKNVKIDGAEIKIPEEVLTVEVAAPNIDIKGPSIDIKTKELEQERRGSKFKFPSFGFKGPDVDITKKDVDVTLPEVKAEVTVPEVKLQQPSSKVKIKAPGFKAQASDESTGLSVDVKAQGGEIEGSGSKFKLPSFGVSMPKVKEPDTDLSLPKKDVHVTLPEANVEVKLPEVEVKETAGAVSEPTLDAEAKAKRPSWTFPRFSFSKASGKVPDADVSLESPKVDATLPEVKAEVSLPVAEVKIPDINLEVKDPKIEIKTPELVGKDGQGGIFTLPSIGTEKAKVSQKEVNITLPEVKAEVKLSEGEIQETEVKSKDDGGSEMDSMGLGSPSKFKMPSFKMPRLSFSRTKSEEEYPPVDTEQKEEQQEVKTEMKEGSKSPKVTSLGEILKNIDVEFDVPKVENVEDNAESSKEAQKTEEPAGKQVDQDTTKSPERTGWFKFRFGLSSPSESPKTFEKDPQKKSPAGETGDEDISPSCSVQSSDAFADISSTVTSELVGPSLASPTKVTVKYSDPKSPSGPIETHSNIVTSMARTERISDVPDLPEKITILSSSMSSSSEDTLQLKSGKIHVITSNIQATPESQHAKLLTAVQVQPAGSLAFTSEANEAAAWTIEDAQGGKRTVFERHLVTETSSERSESKETMVITKQITHVFESSEPISGETASSIQRLRDTVHTEKMRFFDEAEK